MAFLRNADIRTSTPHVLFGFCLFFFILANADRANNASIAHVSQKRSSWEIWKLWRGRLGALAPTGDALMLQAESTMSSRADLNVDFDTLRRDATELADESARLRGLNAQMLGALRYVLPLLQEALPAAVDFDWTKEAIGKVQNAIAAAERDA